MNQKDQYCPHWSEGISPSDFEQVVIEMEREIHELKADAERYRWLKAWNKLDGWDDNSIDRNIAIDVVLEGKLK